MTKTLTTKERAQVKKTLEHKALAQAINAKAKKIKAKRTAKVAKGRAKLEARKPVEPVTETVTYAAEAAVQG